MLPPGYIAGALGHNVGNYFALRSMTPNMLQVNAYPGLALSTP